jgi:hypothetical protein
MNQPPAGGQPQQGPRVTPEMVKNAKTLTCECGGIVFENGLVIKRVSAILSPTSQEMDIPIQVFLCKGCGLALPETDPDGVLPESIKSKPKVDLASVVNK